MRVNTSGYLERKSVSGVWRNWWLIKSGTNNRGYIFFTRVYFPKDLVGEKVRFKMEIIN